MLQWFAFATAAAEEIAEGGQLGLGDGFVEAEVEIEPTAAKDVGKEVLHVEPGFLDLAFLQVGGAGLDDFEATQGFDGLLGVDILGRFDFVIDQNAAVFRLKARKTE